KGFEEWLKGLTAALIAQSQEVRTPPPISYEKQRAFYFRYLRGGNPIYDPSLDELRQSFGLGTVLIGRDLEMMRYSEYSWMIRSLDHSNTEGANLLARAMEVELGFAAMAKRRLEIDVGPKAVELKTICEQRFASAPREPRVLLVLGSYEKNGM